MELFERVSDDVTILEAHGQVDGTTAKEFGDRLVALIHAGRRRIVVDLENIAYISSAGFRALILADRTTEQREGKLALCGVTGEVMRLFELGTFLELFLICPNQQDAISKLRQP